MAAKAAIAGFRASPLKTASGKVYKGRFVCSECQWTGSGADAFVTFTATAAEIADACESRILWTDQSVQRGIKPEWEGIAKQELSLAEGYPIEQQYIFSESNADDMVEKLLSGSRLFLSPLVWNLRPGNFSAYVSSTLKEIFIYDGKVFLPDSHHRHQAILRAIRLWREAPSSYPKFKGDREFKVELYFLDKADEGNYFFDKNQRPRPTAKSKAYDLTTTDDLSLLAKRVIEKAPSLHSNVNRVTDRLHRKNPSVMTLSTLREMMRTFAATDVMDESELDGLATIAAQFYEMLVKVRPELGILDLHKRNLARAKSLADSALAMHGYAGLMRDFNDDIAKLGRSKAVEWWSFHLGALREGIDVEYEHWKGDFFSRENPLWQEVGIIRPSVRSAGTVSNTGGARAAMQRILRVMVKLEQDPEDITGLFV